MAEVNLTIAGRNYQVGCRAGEEDNLVAAARMVDAKSREAGTTDGQRSKD